jgi:hypothetical protein
VVVKTPAVEHLYTHEISLAIDHSGESRLQFAYREDPSIKDFTPKIAILRLD